MPQKRAVKRRTRNEAAGVLFTLAAMITRIGIAIVLMLAAAWARADGHEHHEHHEHATPALDLSAQLARSTSSYSPPAVGVTRQDGRRVDFARELDDGRPVFLNFIYTTCTAICPPMTQTFAALQRKLGDERGKVHMVSVTIDPENDTPRRLAEYAREFNAGPQWSFYTGSVEAMIAVQKAFAAYRGDKMSHTPLTLVRVARDGPWIRLDGFATADDLMREYRVLAAAR
jgi:protein SCO1